MRRAARVNKSSTNKGEKGGRKTDPGATPPKAQIATQSRKARRKTLVWKEPPPIPPPPLLLPRSTISRYFFAHDKQHGVRLNFSSKPYGRPHRRHRRARAGRDLARGSLRPPDTKLFPEAHHDDLGGQSTRYFVPTPSKRRAQHRLRLTKASPSRDCELNSANWLLFVIEGPPTERGELPDHPRQPLGDDTTRATRDDTNVLRRIRNALIRSRGHDLSRERPGAHRKASRTCPSDDTDDAPITTSHHRLRLRLRRRQSTPPPPSLHLSHSDHHRAGPAIHDDPRTDPSTASGLEHEQPGQPPQQQTHCWYVDTTRFWVIL